MSEDNIVKSIYRILLLYEDVPSISEEDYLRYLDRTYLRLKGGKVDSEVLDIVQGLRSEGIALDHDKVKSAVFHMISVVRKGGA